MFLMVVSFELSEDGIVILDCELILWVLNPYSQHGPAGENVKLVVIVSV